MMSKKFKNYVLWLGLLSAFVAAFIYLSMANIEADDSVVYLEFDNSIPMDDDRIKEIQETIEANENTGKDLVFVPKHPVTVLPGEERRKLDEQRAERERKEREATIEASDEFPTSTPLPCETFSILENKPLILVLCGTEVVGIPSAESYIPANNLQEAEALLRAYFQQLLGGISSSDKRAGYYSSFSDSDPSVLNTLTLDANGHVSIDFNKEFKSQLGHLHHSGARLMMDQLYNTVFQFREVNSLAITLDGSCEEFAHLFEFVCINIERDRWQLILDDNHDEVGIFSLRKDP